MASSSHSGLEGSSSSSSTARPESDENPEESAPVVSLLDRLKAPKASEFARNRKVDRNPPPKGKRRTRGAIVASDPKSVSAAQRVREFSDEGLTVSNGKLFCIACREELSLKKNVIANHVLSAKHKTGKAKLGSKEAKERDIALALKQADEQCHPVGETLPIEQRVYRVKVVRTFLRAAVPLNKLATFRELLEEGGFRLTDRRHMSDLVPFILSQEVDQLKTEMNGCPVSVIFDGTTRLGEAMAIVVRFVDADFNIHQRLIRMLLLAHSMTGEEIARELINTLSVRYGISSELLLAAMHDRASTNNIAMRTVKVVYPSLIDVGCFSHTLNLVGEKFATPHLSDFLSSWVTMFSHSPKTRLLWRTQTGRSMPGYSTTRWWSKWEVVKYLVELFGDVEAFLRRNEGIAPSTRGKLLSYFDNPQKKVCLQMEAAIIVDVGHSFVQATYNLEGDGPLALTSYEVISALTTSVNQVQHYPNAQAVARSVSSGNAATQQQLLQYALSCVQPGLQYFLDRKGSSMEEPLACFKAARFFSPSKVHEIRPSALDLDALLCFPFLRSSLSDLKSELSAYLAASEDVSPDLCPLEFWRRHKDSLPSWASAVCKVILVQPSSAASERVFSILNQSFGEQQALSLQDYIEASLMLQYNKH